VIAVVLAVVSVANALGWAVVWTPRTAAHWLTVSPAAARVLARVEAQIPPTGEVVASQGVSGAFARRAWIYAEKGGESFPVRTRPLWVVIAPAQGTELESVANARATVGKFAGPLNATMVANSSGIFAFRWNPPVGTKRFHFSSVQPAASEVPAWTAVGAAGSARMDGAPRSWHVVASGESGYVVAGAYWLEPPGRYSATMRLSCSGRVVLEVRDATTNKRLSQAVVAPTHGIQKVDAPPAAVRRVAGESAYSGIGPFRISPIRAPYGDQIEIRVWTPGGVDVNVYSLELTRSGNA
jgi:hypothetical protein